MISHYDSTIGMTIIIINNYKPLSTIINNDSPLSLLAAINIYKQLFTMINHD